MATGLGLLVAQSPAAFGQGNGAQGRAANEVSGPAAAKSSVEVLTRGPVHEAFAQPINLGRGLAAVINHRPPEIIDEMPAELRPDTEDVAWIPGYWSWDDDRDDFLWVSGVWRVPPPTMRWIAGYWAPVSGGYRWVSGFWTDVSAQAVRYYPLPPPSAERGPTTSAPAADDLWAPGSWTWQEQKGEFAWNRGYWAKAKPGWVWVPSSYLWTPRGYVIANGYWDFVLDNRGMLFAPLAIDPAMRKADFTYVPSVAIDPALLSFYLFVRPAYGHYYFGDYFADKYVRLGIYPWFDAGSVPDYNYDPLLAYDRWYYAAHDPDWMHNLERWNAYYRRHPAARPPRDMAAEQTLATEATWRPDREFLMIGRPLGTVWQNSIFPIRLARVSVADRNKVMEAVRASRECETQRLRMETTPAGPAVAQPQLASHNKAATARPPAKPEQVSFTMVQQRLATAPKRPHCRGASRRLPRCTRRAGRQIGRDCRPCLRKERV